MERDELKEKIAEAIATGMLEPEGIDWSYIKSTPDHPIYECCFKHAEAVLSAIEQSGCTICDGVSCNRPETVEQAVSAVPASSNEDGEAR